MPLDPSIPLQAQSPNPTTLISSFLNLGKQKLELDKSRETFDADVARTKAVARAAGTEADVGARTADARVSSAQSAAGTAAAQYSDAQLANLRNHFANVTQQMTTLLEDPQLNRAKVIGAVTSAALNQNAPTAAIAQAIQGLPDNDDPKALQAFIKQGLARAQQAGAHLDTISPRPAAVSTDQGTQFVNTNPNAAGVPVAAPMGQPITPPNQVANDTSGAPTIINPARGTATPFKASQSGPQMSFPAGETAQTQQALQAERDAAKQAQMAAPQQRDINRNIVRLVDEGTKTGAGAGAFQQLASRLGFSFSGDQTTDYNLLGKYLERSALTAAQGMGPHTNAGLEAQVRANGSTDYTPAAIRKIAVLNDAITSGASLYQEGLERSIGSNGSVFSKRQFDQQWAWAMNPTDGVNGIQALRLKNAVDGKDQKELNAIISEVGGRGSKGATALFQKLQQIRNLAGS